MQTCFRLVPVGFLILASRVVAGEGSVQDVPKPRILAISHQIDALVESKLESRQQKPNPQCDDETFLRRVYLDIAGRIPTYEETTSFLNSNDKDRRTQLIDRLLDSDGYASHQFNFWADILRIKNRLSGGNPGKPYIDFVKHALEVNQPYDEFVRELLTSEGAILDRGNGATGYYLRDQGMPEDNMANTVRVFLGTRLECAQCHDHPFDKWTQREFFEMVAFNGGLRTRLAPDGMGISGALDLRRQIRNADADAPVKQFALNLIRPLTYGVTGGGTGLARLPDSYQYEDGEPNEIVTAKTLFAGQALVHPTIPAARLFNRRRTNQRNAGRIPGAQDIGSREVFADWLTSPDNPRFTVVIANRLWKKSMGLGLIEPVDDITDDTLASNEELLDFLARQMVDLDYDLKQFYRAIYNSKTYQREASDLNVSDAAEYNFPGPLLRRMSAEQLWDSFLALAVPELDSRENPRDKITRLAIGSDIYDGFEKVKDMTAEEVLALAEERLEDRNDPQKRRQRFRDMMMSSEDGNRFREEAQQMRQQIASLRRLQMRARRLNNPQAARALQDKISQLSARLRHAPTRVSPDLVRASELQSPAPAGHFLREFGQSDRDQIENANTEPAVTQVLSLMNGQIEQQIISNPRTVLMRNVVNANSVSDRIEVVYLSMLNRHPSRSERSLWLQSARDDGGEAIDDLIWTLANSSEFMFVR